MEVVCFRWDVKQEKACGDAASELVIIESPILEVIVPLCDLHFVKTDALVPWWSLKEFNQDHCFFFEGPLYGAGQQYDPPCQEDATDTVIIREASRRPYLAKVCPRHKLRHDSNAMHMRKGGKL